MHGVPADLDLSKFKGAALAQVCVGEQQLQFRFHPEGTISVEGRWELRDSAGALVDGSTATNEESDAFRAHLLLGKVVESHSVSAPDFFSLRFNSGHSLVVFDDSKDYESFSIQPGDILV